MRRDAEKSGNFDRADLLDLRLTELTYTISRELGIPDSKRDDPAWQVWEDCWNKIREARRKGVKAEEAEAWNELKTVHGEWIETLRKLPPKPGVH